MQKSFEIFGGSFILDVGEIIESNPHLNFYTLRPFKNVYNSDGYKATTLGTVSRFSTGVQIKITYQVGEAVIFLRPTNLMTNPHTDICYILQRVVLGSAECQNTPTVRSLSNINYWNNDLYTKLNSLTQRNQSLSDFSGLGLLDTFAGDLEIAGASSYVVISDDSISSGTDTSNITISALDRRISQVSTLATKTTMASSEDLSILGKSVIHSSKYSLDSSSAYPVNETVDNIKLKDDWNPVYQYEHNIGAHYHGSLVTMSDINGVNTIASMAITDKGSVSLEAVNSLELTKHINIGNLRYKGPRLNKDIAVASAESIAESFKEQIKSDEDSWESAEGTWFDEYDDLLWNEYGVLRPEQPLFDSYPTIEMGDTELHTGKASIKIEKDGSIKLLDAWGSYILLSKGNIQIHSAGNLFTVAARDSINMAGGSFVAKAEKVMELEASTEHLTITAAKGLWLSSLQDCHISTKAGMTIAATEGLSISSESSLTIKAVTMDTDVVSYGVYSDNDAVINSRYASVVVASMSLGSGICVNSGGVSVYGTATIAGDIVSGSASLIYEADTPDKSFNLSGTGTGNITVPGALTCRGVSCEGAVRATGSILGSSLACPSGEASKSRNNTSSIGAALKRIVSALSKPLKSSRAAAVEVDKPKGLPVSESAACTYLKVIETSQLNSSFSVDGGLELRDNKGYIYPGKTFWETSGLTTVKDGEVITEGFANLKVCQSNTTVIQSS